MRTNKRKSYLMVFLLASIASTPLAAKSKKKLLNRSIYMPIDFELCEHLAEGTSTRTTASCPRCPQGVCSSSRITPTVRSSCPSKVRVRVEGNYLADDEPFTAELSVNGAGHPHCAWAPLGRHEGSVAETTQENRHETRETHDPPGVQEVLQTRAPRCRAVTGPATAPSRFGFLIEQTLEFLAIVVGQLASDADDMKDFDHLLLRLTHREHAVALGRLQE